MPTDGKVYKWDEETLSWKDISDGESTPVVTV
jgi:hypothetical protein